ncbi:MAG: hypothetical protein JO197_10240 [Acidobacteria bacterium]|nr:hypothetical protein [Acidobacteriota bacterium]MBV9477473.1 hypothetical protein [Acidobacteriota bacterium]
MTRTLRISAIFAMLAFASLSSYAQERPLSGTVVDVDEGRSRLQIEPDDDYASRLTIEADSVSTTYYGFGTVIAGKPEIFTGSSGFSNLRLGDRVEIRGASRGQNVYKADRITLLGREVAAPTTGVGQTRNPNSMSTPTDDRATGVNDNAATPTSLDGTIRQINTDEGRLVVQTSDRQMLTVRTSRTTPVTYRGQQYRVANLEVGDHITVAIDPRYGDRNEISARSITVTRSVQEGGIVAPSGGTVTILEGRVTRLDPNADAAYVDDGRGEVRVDMSQANDATGDVMHSRDLRIGDRLDISGSFNQNGDLFLASTVRYASATGGSGSGTPYPSTTAPADDYARYAAVTITGTVTETLEDAGTLSLRDRTTNRIVQLWATDDFVVRTKGTTYTTAGNLRTGDTVVVKAFRDAGGNLVAQTIRLRNR